MCADTVMDAARTGTARVAHPLDPLSAEEITASRDHLVAEGRLTGSVRVAYLSLKEPQKAILRDASWTPDRHARAILLDTATGETTDAVIDLTNHRTVSATTVDV